MIGHLSRILNLGRGTAIIGYVILDLYPNLLPRLLKKYSKIILVSGTNGKTTIVNVLSQIITNSNLKVVSNFEGSNVLRGIISTLVWNDDYNLNGKILLLEVEEATLHKLTKHVSPDIIVLTNIFRDQLDAYGEISRVKNFLKIGLSKNKTKIVFNADDPNILEIVSDLDEVNLFGYSLGNDKNLIPYEDKLANVSNIVSPKYVLEKYNEDKLFLNLGNTILRCNVQKNLAPYALSNMIACITVSNILHIDLPILNNTLSNLKPIFGRGEMIELSKNTLKLCLVKNPVGFDQVIIEQDYRNKKVAIIINDNIADSRDVSWIWDVTKLEMINVPIYVTGIRKYDMDVRLKYSGLESTVMDSIESLINTIDSSRDEFIVFANYTAMNQFRKIISKKYNVQAYKT